MEKLIYEVKHNTSFNDEFDFLETILKCNGVEDIDAFLNVSPVYCHNPYLLDNMDKGLDLLNSVVRKGGNITVKVDCDVDGYTSAAYIIQFIKKISGCNVNYILSENKNHGICCNDSVVYDNTELFIVPDAGSNDTEACKEIQEKYGIPILILDHHQMCDKNIHKYAAVINCTDGNYPNNTLSGVGVVHKFCLAYCNKYDIPKSTANYFLDLVALGMIADSMDMRNLETRYYTLEGLKDVYYNNEFLNELCERLSDSMKFGRTIKSIGWTVAPVINAMVRYGSHAEQVDTMRALIGEQETIEYQPRRKNKDDPKPPLEYHSLQKTMARVCCNVKARQDKEVREYFKTLQNKIDTEKLNDNSIIMVDATEILKKNTVTGLLANKLVTAYKRPAIVLKEKNSEIYGGSARGYGKGAIRDFNKFLTGLNLFIKCAGHSNAFGVEISKQNCGAVIKKCNQLINKDDLVTVHEADYEIKASDLVKKQIEKVAKACYIWGNGVDEPVFAVTDLIIPAREISGIGQGDYVSFIKFEYRGITFIKKYCGKSDYELMTNKQRTGFGANRQTVKLTLLVTFELDIFDGSVEPVAVIQNFYSEPIEEQSTSGDDFFF